MRFTAGLLAGCITAITNALVATLAARILWPEYAAAEPNKTYNATMLIARLAAGAVCAAGAACATTAIARDNGKAAWWLGGLFLTASVPEHFLRVWANYPIWYHLIYLSYLVPLTGLVGWVVANWLDKNI